MSSEINFEEMSGLGIVTLTRPDVLNALTTEMCKLFTRKLNEWQDKAAIKAVVVRGAGNKSFCAGGDIRVLVEQGPENNVLANEFFASEYKLNATIFHFQKPFIALLDGIVMGGGVGISVHGSHRIITENTLFAMPEAAIGLVPDVGASYFLPRSPGKVGTYLGMTGARLKGSDILYAGIGTAFMNSEKIELLMTKLAETEISSYDDVDAIVATLADDPGAAPLDEYRDLIDAAFAENSVEGICEHLSIIDHEWAKETHAVLMKMSPISLKVFTEQLHRSANLDFDECMVMEYRIASAILSYDSDFYEGVRAVLIDKDHNPNWIPASLKEVTNDMVQAHFQVPGSGDLLL